MYCVEWVKKREVKRWKKHLPLKGIFSLWKLTEMTGKEEHESCIIVMLIAISEKPRAEFLVLKEEERCSLIFSQFVLWCFFHVFLILAAFHLFPLFVVLMSPCFLKDRKVISFRINKEPKEEEGKLFLPASAWVNWRRTRWGKLRSKRQNLRKGS